MALSKDWTLKQVRSLLRLLANSISQQEIVDAVLDDFVHLAVCDLAELLSNSSFPDYVTTATVTQVSGVIDISTLRVDRVDKLVDATNGLCIKVNSKEFENMANISQYTKNVWYYQAGDSIYINKGATAGLYGTLTLYYIRIPTKATLDADFIDMRDKFMKLVVDKAKVLLYEELKVAAPDSLTNSINNNIQQIRAANIDELKTVNASKSEKN